MSLLSSLSVNDFLRKASHVASHYGFKPLETITRDTLSLKKVGADLPPISEIIKRDPFGSIAAQLLERCVSCNAINARKREPRLIYHVTLPRGSGRSGRKSVKFGIAVIGCNKSIGEALVIKTSLSILEDVGIKNATVYINSVGDRDSMARYARELSTHLRRHVNELPPTCQQAMKRDPLEALEEILGLSLPILESLPRPLHYLSEVSRRHLREVLEFMELDNIPYNIEDYLLGPRDCYTQTLFEIRHPESAGGYKTIVRGGRCDELSRKNFRTSLPIVGAVFEHEMRDTSFLKNAMRLRQPKFFLVQLGFNAKLLSLSVLESLRKAHIPVSQAIDNDSLRDQLEFARVQRTPYLIILGQREAIDKTAIVRNVTSQAQEIVPIGILSSYLKNSLRI